MASQLRLEATSEHSRQLEPEAAEMATRRNILISMAAFSVFALLGPLIAHFSWGRLESFVNVDHLLILIWPGRFLAAGGSPNNFHDKVASLVGNVVWFNFWGLLAGLLARRKWTIILLYVVVGSLTGLFEAWGSGFSVRYFSWSAVLVALLLYCLPFCAVIWSSRAQQL